MLQSAFELVQFLITLSADGTLPWIIRTWGCSKRSICQQSSYIASVQLKRVNWHLIIGLPTHATWASWSWSNRATNAAMAAIHKVSSYHLPAFCFRAMCCSLCCLTVDRYYQEGCLTCFNFLRTQPFHRRNTWKSVHFAPLTIKTQIWKSLF